MLARHLMFDIKYSHFFYKKKLHNPCSLVHHLILSKIGHSQFCLLSPRFRVTILNAILLLYCAAFFLLHVRGNQLVFLCVGVLGWVCVCVCEFFFFFFSPISVFGFVGMVSAPLLPHSSWLFPSIVFYST